MAASEVDISNLALAHVADEAAVADISPSDGTIQGDHCERFYPIALQVCLEEFQPHFARRRTALTSIDNPLESWAYAYRLPATCLLPLRVLPPDSTDETQKQPFIVEADDTGELVLYTDMQDAVLKYLFLANDTSKYTGLFISALSWLLASYVAGPLTKNPKVVAACYARYLVELGKGAASSANASQNNSQYGKHTPSHLAARR